MTMKNLTFPILLFSGTLAGLLTYGQHAVERERSVVRDAGFPTNSEVWRMNIGFDAYTTLQTNWVPVETLTGKREVGVVISNTYARVIWGADVYGVGVKTNDYIQESVVVGQALERKFQWPHYPTNVNIIIMPSYTNWWPHGLTNLPK